ncbi:MAG TPA: 3-mercaptopyruvate sulfurtransferase [Caulobacteraceae bacterium]|jgi:thiosulfate/3-mercaptopyruvate sulfurtransferase|nr:3-mercaptopyruvate sulfurtransferase [Caulobacteraceae bacterium]
MSQADPLVTAAWLKARIAAPDLRTVDASWFLPGSGRDPDAEFLERHIPGSVRLDIDAVSDRAIPLPHMLPDPMAFAQTVGEMGLGSEHRIVVYASEGILPAARVWWMFRVMGHDAVTVLDGGLAKWLAIRGPLQAGPAASRPPARFRARFRKDLVRSFDQVAETLEQGTAQVVDVRPAPRFRGEAPEPRPGLRPGHMPGALNAPYAELIAPDGTLKAKAALQKAFAHAHVALDRPIVTSCGSGVSAAVTALALARLGLWDVAVYDGSWAEWGGRDDAAVVIGAA